MKLSLEDIRDREKDKVGIVIGLGPSLNEHMSFLEKLSSESRDKVAFFCSNMFNSITSIQSDYWSIFNNQACMSLDNAHERYSSQKDSVVVFTTRIKGFTEDKAEKLLKNDYLSLSSESILSSYLQEYTSSPEKYSSVHSVIIHQIALAIITGCKKIFITGVDLDYSNGYAKKGFHESGVKMGKTYMDNQARTITLNQIKDLSSWANNVGCEIYSLNSKGHLTSVLSHKGVEYLKNLIEE